jgi:acyl-CoA reductase-like NAD-dependent aldehyde dehydrogenase
MEILVLSFSFPSSIVVLDDLVQEEMLIAKDEIFGPVMALAKFK